MSEINEKINFWESRKKDLIAKGERYEVIKIAEDNLKRLYAERDFIKKRYGL